MRTCENDDDILSYVRILTKTRSNRLRQELVRGASTRVIKTICNFCSNALYNTEFKPHVSNCKTLQHNKALIRVLATRRVALTEKRRILARHSGSFLGELVPAISNALGANVHDVVSR